MFSVCVVIFGIIFGVIFVLKWKLEILFDVDMLQDLLVFFPFYGNMVLSFLSFWCLVLVCVAVLKNTSLVKEKKCWCGVVRGD